MPQCLNKAYRLILSLSYVISFSGSVPCGLIRFYKAPDMYDAFISVQYRIYTCKEFSRVLSSGIIQPEGDVYLSSTQVVWPLRPC